MVGMLFLMSFHIAFLNNGIFFSCASCWCCVNAMPGDSPRIDHILLKLFDDEIKYLWYSWYSTICISKGVYIYTLLFWFQEFCFPFTPWYVKVTSWSNVVLFYFPFTSWYVKVTSWSNVVYFVFHSHPGMLKSPADLMWYILFSIHILVFWSRQLI